MVIGGKMNKTNKGISIKIQLIVFFLIVMMIPTLLINIGMYGLASKTLKERKANDILYSLSRSKERLDTFLKDIDYKLIALGLDIQNLNIDHDYEKLLYEITRIKKLNPNIESINVFLDEENRIISSSETQKEVLVKESKYYNWLEAPIYMEKENSGWLQTKYFNNNYNIPKRVFFIKKKIEDFGQIAIFINETTLRYNYMDNPINENELNTFLIDEHGKILSNKDISMIGKYMDNVYMDKGVTKEEDWYIKNLNGEKMLMIYTTSSYTNWTYMSMIPMKNVLLDKREVYRIILLINAISLPITIFLAILFSKRIYQPIGELKGAMKEVEKGNLNVQVYTCRKDEFNILYHGFNRMINRIKKLIQELYHEKLLHKEAELQNLQAQINPHFLYNTLDTIHWMARLNKMEEVSYLTFSLSNFYKLRLGDGKKYTTIGETMELVREFLNIKRIKYGEDFAIEINIQEDLNEVTILKFIIQPIVENAMYHGIEKKKGANKILINVLSISNYIIFKIEDDGLGIEEEKLKILKKLLNDMENENNVEGKYSALLNIQKRVKLKYGVNCGLNIESQYNKGTKVTLKLPKTNIKI